ncbi:Hint domain-containing protein [Aquicoccus sp. G2-2]|uniref:Hint domain-containing protein n=1 Tax=Aquicoccus sp. G2-2 TaxID=3092120 RepID=UPI002ADFCDB0|nr:Hint domain-containing protein [Aquicoccus sp. G2-2]MEA1113626.1 Hint domain-containing protein [Aquicoccus sp. G2-2]
MGNPQPSSGAVTEDSGVVGELLSTTGDADFGPWVNNDSGQWTAATLTGAYGSQLVIDSDGNWTYTATNSNASIQALDTGQSLTEVFTVNSTQGPTTVTITINGADEPPCFVAGTPIDTPHGPTPVEVLRAGDMVVTRDHGLQAIRWIGSTTVTPHDGPDPSRLMPVRLCKDALGPGVPDRDILLSPMHRVMIGGADIGALFGANEVFCALSHLVNGQSIRREAVEDVTYYHILFDSHQVLMSSGCASESFYPGQIGLNGFADETREEVLTLFPELRSLPESYGRTARPVLRGYEARLLRERLIPEFPFLRTSQTPKRVA